MSMFKIKRAEVSDTGLILSLIKELADYERMSDEVVAGERQLREWIFEKGAAEVFIGYYKDEAVGFTLSFHNFSTFIGKSGLYLEDLYVRPDFRGNGFGKALFLNLVRLAKERGYGRMEWSCLDWNQPSIAFYRSLGAEPMSEWTVYRLNEAAIRNLTV